MALQDGNATGLWIVLFVFSKFPELLDTAAFFITPFMQFILPQVLYT